jgi:hypothetical protein
MPIRSLPPSLRRRAAMFDPAYRTFLIKKSNQCSEAATKVKVATGLADLGNDSA